MTIQSIDIPVFLLIAGGGFLIGVFFFGGLWYTVQKAVSRPAAGLWFFASLVIRTTVAMAGFYLLSAGDWKKMLLALGGFIIAKLAVVFMTRNMTGGREDEACI